MNYKKSHIETVVITVFLVGAMFLIPAGLVHTERSINTNFQPDSL